MYKISIVIVTFNCADYLDENLSALEKSLDGFSSQVILIDNASQDGTTEVVRKTDFTQVFNNENVGFTKAVNQGLQLAKGKFVLILNPDVKVTENIFDKLFEQLNSDEIGIVAPQLRFPDGTIQPSCRRFPSKKDVLFRTMGLHFLFSKSDIFNHWMQPSFDHKTTRFVDQPQGAFLLFNKELLDEIGFLDERFAMFFSDVDFCKRVIDSGKKILFYADAFVYHIKGASINRQKQKMIVTSHRSFVDYFAKYDKNKWQQFTSFGIKLLLLVITLPRLFIATLKNG